MTTKTIAVDFDGTLCQNAWPEIGEENAPIIAELKRRQEQGDKLILWTCRSGRMLDAAILWCLARDLRFDAINENLPEHMETYGNDCRKVFADEYWDDKSVLVYSGSVSSLLIPQDDGTVRSKVWQSATLTVKKPSLFARLREWLRL